MNEEFLKEEEIEIVEKTIIEMVEAIERFKILTDNFSYKYLDCSKILSERIGFIRYVSWYILPNKDVCSLTKEQLFKEIAEKLGDD